jgi:hypothetical protein
VDEAEYWTSLRFRINCLSTNHPARRLALPGWCDWFEPEKKRCQEPFPGGYVRKGS